MPRKDWHIRKSQGKLQLLASSFTFYDCLCPGRKDKVREKEGGLLLVPGATEGNGVSKGKKVTHIGCSPKKGVLIEYSPEIAPVLYG